MNYAGYSIDRAGASGMFSAYVGGKFWCADTLPGIREIIRDEMWRDGAAFLHFGTGSEPRQTVRVPARVSRLWQHIAGVPFTASGYGLKIPSPFQVYWRGKWRRVYVCQISNAGSAYIGKPGAWEATVSEDHENPPS